MAKKWLHIILSVWIINVIVCFHAVNPFENALLSEQATATASLRSATLLDLFSQETVDEADKSQKHNKIHQKSRYVTARVIDNYVPAIYADKLEFSVFHKDVAAFTGQYVTKAFLPSYYNFLFRLSPF
ncbi:hypothetical protein FPZ43_17275 [Mucilaginibacter pallidiroseus]|uniref:Uncharacterized protein n=1 Tax=Mucilaginibacter pallidiroseus TaxID=2599295 RepID=A0A563U267_9SPHI|nr:hypothetical protein [Mucilaginibacter pallidiroseus]TWR25221.1 hypothetical protein FPZ43_17275 [Mucilaginibacter pallidiroseus]